MKEKINQLAKGMFTYELPKVQCSSNTIQFNVEIGKTYQGEFEIHNAKEVEMKGLVYSSSPAFHLCESSFVGRNVTISFVYDATTEEKANQTKTGTVTVVSNLGEFSIPYEVTLQVPFFDSSLGEVRDLFHLTNLCKTNWSEALNIFLSPDFKTVILHDNEKYISIYESLMKSPGKDQALEEFLIAVHKKMPISLEVETKEYHYENIIDNFEETIVITKDGPGYKEFSITSESDWILFEKREYTTLEFVADRLELTVMIDASKLRPGRNETTVVIESLHQQIIVPMEVATPIKTVSEEQLAGRENRKKRKEYECSLTKSYLAFRLNQISKEEYIDALQAGIHNLESVSPSTRNQLLRIHYYMIAGREDQLIRLMASFIEHEKELFEESILYYLDYLYLKAIVTKANEDIWRAIEAMKLYQREVSNWQLSWYLLYLEEELQDDVSKRLECVLKECRKGVTSPILYYEACSCYNDEPQLLQEINPITKRILHFAIKHNAVQNLLAEQYVYLASRMKQFDVLVFTDLCSIYQQFHTVECLQTICRMCINGRKTDAKYFTWYEQAIKAQQKITELYEYYMYSMDWTTEVELEQSVLLYFIYNNNLSDAMKTNLYAYVVEKKEELVSIYRTYQRQIENFAQRMLLKGAINKKLAVLYREVFTMEELDENIARALSKVLFASEVICTNPKVTGIVVYQPELEKEEIVPLNNQRAVVSICTEHSYLYLLDDKQYRYLSQDSCTVEPLLDVALFAKRCFEKAKNEIPLLIYQNEKMLGNDKANQETFFLKNRLLESDEVSIRYKKNAYVDIIDYYYTMGNMDKLEEYLRMLDLSILPEKDRIKVIEYQLMRSLYEEAGRAMRQYGYEKIAIKYVKRYVIYLLSKDSKEEEFKTALCYYLYSLGKANHQILTYLLEHYSHSTKRMYELWVAGRKEELSTVELEERLLGQMLFSESLMLHSYEVFSSYYRHAKTKVLVKAYLAYLSYKYVTKDRVVNEEVFAILKQESLYYESKVNMLALLKYDSMKGNLTEDELVFCDYNIHKFIKEGIVLPFFKDYQGRIDLPHNIYDKQYVGYIANPENEVHIIYAIVKENEEEPEFVEEVMKDVFEGIRVKDFILFYGESLQYYIKEISAEGESITESINVSIGHQMEDANNQFAKINLMYAALDMKDETTLLELMAGYVKEEYITDHIFTPL